MADHYPDRTITVPGGLVQWLRRTVDGEREAVERSLLYGPDPQDPGRLSRLVQLRTLHRQLEDT